MILQQFCENSLSARNSAHFSLSLSLSPCGRPSHAQHFENFSKKGDFLKIFSKNIILEMVLKRRILFRFFATQFPVGGEKCSGRKVVCHLEGPAVAVPPHPRQPPERNAMKSVFARKCIFATQSAFCDNKRFLRQKALLR